jgi:hypothetical protein
MPFRGYVAECSLCKTTKTVCFWRPGTPYTRRKRTLLPIPPRRSVAPSRSHGSQRHRLLAFR